MLCIYGTTYSLLLSHSYSLTLTYSLAYLLTYLQVEHYCKFLKNENKAVNENEPTLSAVRRVSEELSGILSQRIAALVMMFVIVGTHSLSHLPTCLLTHSLTYSLAHSLPFF